MPKFIYRFSDEQDIQSFCRALENEGIGAQSVKLAECILLVNVDEDKADNWIQMRGSLLKGLFGSFERLWHESPLLEADSIAGLNCQRQPFVQEFQIRESVVFTAIRE